MGSWGNMLGFIAFLLNSEVTEGPFCSEIIVTIVKGSSYTNFLIVFFFIFYANIDHHQ